MFGDNAVVNSIITNSIGMNSVSCKYYPEYNSTQLSKYQYKCMNNKKNLTFDWGRAYQIHLTYYIMALTHIVVLLWCSFVLLLLKKVYIDVVCFIKMLRTEVKKKHTFTSLYDPTLASVSHIVPTRGDHTPLCFITTYDKKLLPYIICHR